MEFIHPTLPNQHPRLKFKYTSGWSQDVLFISDCHADSSECVLDVLLDDLTEAKRRDALIVDCGDFFDVINSRDDKRRSLGSMRDENKVDAYVDSVLDFALDKFGKFADQFLYFGTGNHESKLTKICGTDITRRFVDELNRLRSPGLPPIYRAGYGGWLRVLFERDTKGGADRQSCNVKIFHGAGGGAPVTKNAMEVQRMASAIHGADIVATGHNHQGWTIPHMVETLSDSSVAQTRRILHFKIPGYKMDYRLNGAPTWAMQGGFSPHPIGGYWVKFEAPNSSRILWSAQETQVDYSRVA